MRIRLQLGTETYLRRTPGRNRGLALAAAVLLVPPAFLAAVLAAWRVAADLGLAGPFGVASGPFSHWVSWVAVSFASGGAAYRLNRYGRGPR